ncbi:MAG: hypothetical protein K2Y37_11370 [Pirellulales bacterium]|nr:hypothetical protein [Pirellulales bacterium]
MDATNSAVVLVTHARSYAASGGQWHFELRTSAGKVLLTAADREADVIGPRLELLAAVRGLEALDSPADVTLMTASRYVRRGIVYGLDHWRQTGWTWEWFGQMVPVRNHDLWQRVDRALEFHNVKCPPVRVDAPHGLSNMGPETARRARRERFGRRTTHMVDRDHHRPAELVTAVAPTCAAYLPEPPGFPRTERPASARRLRLHSWLVDQQEALWLRLAQFGTGWLPRPWLE